VLTLRAGVGASAGVARALVCSSPRPSWKVLCCGPMRCLDLGEPMWRDAPFTRCCWGTAIFRRWCYPNRRSGAVFEVVPVTATEAAWVRLRGARALRDAWAEAGIDVRDPRRGAAAL